MTIQEALRHLHNADVHRDKRKFKEAHKLIETILPVLEAHEKWDSCIKAYNIKAGCYYLEGSKSVFNKAHTNLDIALYVGKIHMRNSPELAETYNIKGILHFDLDQYKEALLFFQKAMKLRKKILQKNSVDIGNSHNNIGIVYMEKGDYFNAQDHFNEALNICNNNNDDNIPIKKLRVTIYGNKGEIFRIQGKYRKALTYTEKIFNIRLKLYESNDTKIADNHFNMGAIYGNMGEYEKELHCYNKAIEIWEGINENHLSLAFTYHGVGMYHLSKQKYDTALHYFQNSVNIWQKIDSNHSKLIRPLRGIALCYSHIGNFKEGQFYFEKSLKLQNEAFEEYHSEKVQTLNGFVLHFLNQKKIKKASEYAHKAIISAIRGYNENNIFKNPNITDIESNVSPKQLLDALSMKGKCFTLWSKKISENKKKTLFKYSI